MKAAKIKSGKHRRRLEASAELDRLKAKVGRLRGILTPQAIMLVWLSLGDQMWVEEWK